MYGGPETATGEYAVEVEEMVAAAGSEPERVVVVLGRTGE